MRRVVLIAAGVLALAIAVTVLALGSIVRRGLSTHEDPSAVEAWMARTIRHWSVPAELRNEKNPIVATPDVLESARSHWADHCASCHGNDGKGQTTIGRSLYPRAPDMTLAATQSLSDGELFAIIENGIRLTGMPGWGNGTAASGKGSWELVHFIRHLPAITAQELEQMKNVDARAPAASDVNDRHH